MKPLAAHASRLTACLCGIALTAAVPSVAGAQTATGPEPPPGYQDRLIDDGKLSPDISEGDYYSSSDTSGLAHAIRLEGVASVLQQEGPNAAPDLHENGVLLDAQWDTHSYGAWSLDATGRIGTDDDPRLTGGGGSRTAFSLHERGMPFDDGWFTDNALGDLNTPLITLGRTQTRFMLTSGAMAGLTTEWRGPDNIQIVAGGGEPGVYEGIKVPTFQTLGGTTATVGAEWSPAPQWVVGAEYAGARNAALYLQPVDSNLFPPEVSSQRINSNTGFLSAAWQDTGNRAQLNVIDGTLDGNANAFGIWADGSHTQGAYSQMFGLFRIDPNLSWGNQLITSDVEGGYYRVNYQSRRWIADFGVDEVRSVSGLGPQTTFFNSDARYQLSRDIGIGGVANLRYTPGNTAWSLEGYLDNLNSLGSTRVQLDYATDPQTQDATVTLQQNWEMRQGTRLATSVAVDRLQSTAIPGYPQDTTVLRLAAYGGGDLTTRLSVDGTIQWATAVQGRAAPSTSADVALRYQITRHWTADLDYYENRIGSWTPLVVTSPLAPPTPTPVPMQGVRGIFLSVLYQAAGGAHFVPLGGAAGSGAGRLSGVVYLDANENGRFDAGESGVANVTVILDGRFSVRTDGNGRYDFPAVVAGHHVITVQQDNLPLPWTLNDSGRTEVDVKTRDRTELDIGALRLK
jgi:hypothetical protein